MQSDFIIPYNLWVNLTKTVKQLQFPKIPHNFRNANIPHNFRNTNIFRKCQIVQMQSLNKQVLLQLQIGDFSMVVDLQFLQCRFAEYFFICILLKGNFISDW